jgi:hypothetical protein
LYENIILLSAGSSQKISTIDTKKVSMQGFCINIFIYLLPFSSIFPIVISGLFLFFYHQKNLSVSLYFSLFLKIKQHPYTAMPIDTSPTNYESFIPFP